MTTLTPPKVPQSMMMMMPGGFSDPDQNVLDRMVVLPWARARKPHAEPLYHKELRRWLEQRGGCFSSKILFSSFKWSKPHAEPLYHKELQRWLEQRGVCFSSKILFISFKWSKRRARSCTVAAVWRGETYKVDGASEFYRLLKNVTMQD